MSQILKLQAKDADLARELFQLLSSAYGSRNAIEVSDAYVGNALNNNTFHALAAVQDNHVLGGLTAYELTRYKTETTDMFLREVAVKQEHRQKGIAKQLVQELKSVCKRRGIRHLFVVTERFNIAALELLKESGGKPDMDSIVFTFDVE